ncbi:MAG: NUDIX domain-containing protein [Lachnospiraceae bacterium]|nr:NUDIX domain-containing protein [Lachnospiraceae bacterium]
MLTRKSSRAIVLNKQHQIFLFRYTFDFFAEEQSVWITPGGGLEEGESFEEALEREVYEELGIKLTEPASFAFYRTPLYELKNGETVRSEERFYLIYCDEKSFSYDGWSDSETRRMTAGKWWSVEEIRKSTEKFFSEDVVEILERLARGEISKESIEIA